MKQLEGSEAPEDDEERNPGPRWTFLTSSSGLGQWLAHFDARGELTAYAPPGVAVSESWDDEGLMYWRTARWSTVEQLDGLEPPIDSRRLSGLVEAVQLVPEDALPDTDIHRWMIEATEAYADSLRRLARMKDAQADPQASALSDQLKRVIQVHQGQAALAAHQFSARPMSAQQIAELVAQDPDSLVAQTERLLKDEEELPEFAAAVRALERQSDKDSVLEALTTLVFAKHHSRSFQYMGPVRDASRTVRRLKRAL
jgi:hypothetical protein